MKTIFTSLFIFVVLFSFGQNTFKTEIFTYPFADFIQSIQLDNGDIVSVGSSYSTNLETHNIILAKTDANGKILASKALALSTYNASIVKTLEGGIALCTSNSDVLTLTKLSSQLSLQWQKQYIPATGNIAPNKIIQASNGDYIIGGLIYSDDNKTNAACVVKTDSQGALIFSKSYFDYTDYIIFDLTATRDGNFAFLAISGNRVEDRTPFVVKIKPDGSIIWARQIYTNGEYMEATSLISTSEGGILVTGDFYQIDNSDNYQLLMMVKFNSIGTTAWSKAISTPGESGSIATSVTEDKDGYVFIGDLFIDSEDEGHYIYAVKVDTSSRLQWTKAFKQNTDTNSFLNNIIATNDGGYITCGLRSEGIPYTSAIYKYNNSFEICGETANSIGTVQEYGSSIPISLETADLTTTTSGTNVPIIDVGNAVYICSNILPLQLLSFNATLQHKSVNVNWQTANEVNTDYFVVERSANGSSFTALQKIAAKGNSSVTQTYSTNDLQPLQGTSYYRLQQVDKDGKTTYSSIVKVVVMNNGTIVISPNPVQSNIRVIVQSSANSNLTLQVMDMKGNVLATQKTAVGEGRNEVNIPAASLAKGVYILKVMDKGSVQTIRFVKE